MQVLHGQSDVPVSHADRTAASSQEKGIADLLTRFRKSGIFALVDSERRALCPPRRARPARSAQPGGALEWNASLEPPDPPVRAKRRRLLVHIAYPAILQHGKRRLPMNINAYPHGIDWTWIASDSKGNIGVFTTAGEGPVPECILQLDPASIENIEGRIGEMPIVSNVKIIRSKPADSFIEFGRRGLLVFDWTAIHPPAAQAIDSYEPLVAPVDPVGIDTIPADLARIAAVVKLPKIDSADGLAIDIRAQLDCVEASHADLPHS